MADLVILVLFLISGAITGWIGVNWLPEETLDHITNLRKQPKILNKETI